MTRLGRRGGLLLETYGQCGHPFTTVKAWVMGRMLSSWEKAALQIQLPDCRVETLMNEYEPSESRYCLHCRILVLEAATPPKGEAELVEQDLVRMDDAHFNRGSLA